ncbi:MAG TPA: histidinol-phosphate transaminase [Syntrophales bacterium]|nr:histidinol-phosphate transaminase [Syntrophales bacterium]
MDLGTLIKKEVREQQGYRADATPYRTRMDANESPFSLPPLLKTKLFKEMKNVALNRYPEPGATLIRKRFAEHYGVPDDMIMIGNGSDELIQILCTALAKPQSVVMVPAPTFVMYGIIASNAGHAVAEVPLNAFFDLDLDAMLTRVATDAPVLTFLSYPNSPTANCFSEKSIAAIVEASTGIVVVDEAYGSFSGKTFLPLLKKHDNLVILKTLSKVGLAAMRIGFLIAAPSLVHELDKVRLPYNINALSQVAAGFYLNHIDTFLGQMREIIASREELLSALGKIQGINPYPSDANFIFFSCDFDADTIYSKLVEEGILVKNLNSPGILKNCMRVTVGSREENKEFLKVLKKILLK